MTEIKIFIWEEVDKFRVVLRYPDGREEISDNSWATREECEAAIKEYAAAMEGEIKRVQ